MTTEQIVWTIDGHVKYPDSDDQYALSFSRYVYATKELAQSAAEDRLSSTIFHLRDDKPWQAHSIGGYGYTFEDPYADYVRPVYYSHETETALWIQVERTIVRTDGKY